MEVMEKMFETLIDSEIENNPLAPGKYYEKIIRFDPGQHSFMAVPKDLGKYKESMGYFHLQIFSQDGVRIASDDDNIPGCCHIILIKSTELKFRVSRSQSSIQNMLHFEVRKMPGSSIFSGLSAFKN